jgi:hypothetical protein
MPPIHSQVPVSEEDGESFESIPWESLSDSSSDNRRWYVAAGVIVALGILVSVSRGLVAPTPIPIHTDPSPVVLDMPTTTSPPEVVTEADLMAIEPAALERTAAGAAEIAVVEFFTGDSQGVWADVVLSPGRVTFVEYARALTVTPVGAGLFEVIVAVSVLDAEDGEAFIRRPLRGVSMIIDATDGIFRPLDLPAPVALPLAPFEGVQVTSAVVDPSVLTAVAEALSEFGVVSIERVSYGLLTDGSARLVVEITDPGGTTWPMALRLEPDGTLLVPPSP